MTSFAIEQVSLPDSGKGKKMNTKPLAQERAAPQVHETRAYETWNPEDIHTLEDKPWVPPTSLQAPKERDGFTQRWVRVSERGVDDVANWARKTREGWRPRPADSVPAGFEVPTISHGKFAGCIGVEGMVLCEMPKKMADRRRKAINDKTALVTNTLEAELQAQSDSRMPITQQRSSKVVREVKVQED